MKNATLELTDGTKRHITCSKNKTAMHWLVSRDDANCVILDLGHYLYRDQINIEKVKQRISEIK